MNYPSFRRFGGVLCFIDGWAGLIGGPLCLIGAIIIWIVGSINQVPNTAPLGGEFFGIAIGVFISGFVSLGLGDLLYHYDDAKPSYSSPREEEPIPDAPKTEVVNIENAVQYHYQSLVEAYRKQGLTDEQMLEDLYSRYEHGFVEMSEVKGVADTLGYEIDEAELEKRKADQKGNE
jgi:hypothetical protein